VTTKKPTRKPVRKAFRKLAKTVHRVEKRVEKAAASERSTFQRDGRVPDFSRPLDLSCPNWEELIMARASLMPKGLLARLDQHRAELAVEVFNQLKIPDVTGTPTFGEAGGEWWNEITRAVFGSWNGIQRAITEFFVLVPKKNSKTTNSAGLMVTAMVRSERPRSELLLVAPTHAVASLSFQQAVGMIESDAELLSMCQIQEYIKKITFLPTKCALQIKSFDPSVLTGIKPTAVLIDELHVIAEHSNADRVLGQIRGGIISQPEGFMVTITTQSERVPRGVFRTELLKARMIRDGQVKGVRMLPILYEFPESLVRTPKGEPKDDWKDSANWDMVTPNNGRSITVSRLVEEYDKAVISGTEELRRWASQHLNIEIGMALRSDHWVGGHKWIETGITLNLAQLIERSEIITVGIDGGGLADMLGLTVCGREKETGCWLTWSKAWLHKTALEYNKQDESVLRDLERDGDLVIVENMGEDMDQVGEVVEEVVKSDKLWKVGLDPSGIGAILDKLEEVGVRNGDREEDKQIVGISQGWRLNAAIKTTERKLAEGKLLHATQGLMRWSVENARVEPRGNAILITKQASGYAKIDPLMALFNSIELMSQNPAPAEKQYQMMILGA
jgi:phage terminase large subunit-like protein